ncbi:MAG TPA: exodeoxyribonuclease VII large subunit [Gemmatimonadales bacterium]|nr:exodeoxyribonuclease VII large subunit [Gemmatimonadales bacterium]
MTLSLPLDAAPGERPYTVLEAVEAARRVVEHALPPLWVEGEISNFKAYPSGHWYFSLKDPSAQLRCVMWRSDARRVPATPEDGLKVFARGLLTVDSKRGQLQLAVRELLATTQGGFYAIALARARAALEKDGLLDPARKRRLPAFPQVIGVITSPEGAVWHDIVAVIARRWPAVELVLIGARVQGEGASEDLCRALALAARCERLDVLIVGRGGGSKEDLWAFNDERVARAVAASRAPTIAAVGHETDVTLTDLVADVRAPTPSAAAEAAVPDREEILLRLRATAGGLGSSLARRLALAEERLAHATTRLSSAVDRRVAAAAERLHRAATRMGTACVARITAREAALARLAASLDALSPLKVLERGYAVARDEAGTVLRRTADFPAGRRFRLRVADGEVPARSERSS